MAAYINYDYRGTGDLEDLRSTYTARTTEAEGNSLTIEDMQRAVEALRHNRDDYLPKEADEPVRPNKEDVVGGVLCEHCEKFMFYTTHMPTERLFMTSRMLYMIGEYPKEGEIICCQHCGRERRRRINVADFIRVDPSMIP